MKAYCKGCGEEVGEVRHVCQRPVTPPLDEGEEHYAETQDFATAPDVDLRALNLLRAIDNGRANGHPEADIVHFVLCELQFWGAEYRKEERERCAGIAKELSGWNQGEWSLDTDRAWSVGWKRAADTIETKIRGKK